MNYQDWVIPTSVTIPLVLGLSARLLRRANGVLVSFVNGVRDLITLRMVLRDTAPEERSELIDAHRAWRTATPGRRRRK